MVGEMATIKDVAKEAGVSVATVSRVINRNGYVQEETRKLVEAAISKLNYLPNEVARSLYFQKSKLIGLIIPDITNPFFPEIARGVEDVLQQNGYRLIIGNSDEDAEKEVRYIETFTQHNVLGVISTSSEEISQWEKLNIPVVLLDRIHHDFPFVCSDQKEGGRLAAQILLDRGSRNITLLRGPKHVRTAYERFFAALEVLGKSQVQFQVLNTSFSFDGALETAGKLFELYPDTDGVIAVNDIVASAVLREALLRGKKIPEEMQIIGFDDIPMSKFLFPALSTIQQPAYEMGKEAAKLLLERIRQTDIRKKQIILPVSFVERETTRKAGDGRWQK
jgi:LacI family transcriptional regulator